MKIISAFKLRPRDVRHTEAPHYNLQSSGKPARETTSVLRSLVGVINLTVIMRSLLQFVQ